MERFVFWLVMTPTIAIIGTLVVLAIGPDIFNVIAFMVCLWLVGWLMDVTD